MRWPGAAFVAAAWIAVVALVCPCGCSQEDGRTTRDKWAFDAKEASRRQVETAAALGAPKDLTLALGGGVSMKLVLIPAGKFQMGSPAGEKGRDSDEGPQHEVTLTKPFYMGACEVTQEQYEQTAGTNPSYFKGRTNPVEGVSWDDATAFCRKLSAKTGRTVRLPTEAQWEYACRAGTSTPFHTGATISTDEANCNGNYTYGSRRRGVYRRETLPVGSFAPNAFGLYDMHGNLWEWCQDWGGSYANAEVVDPQGAASGSGRVVRGGSWRSRARRCRSAYRIWNSPDVRISYVGFRVVVFAGVD